MLDNPRSRTEITIATKRSTEQSILGKIFVLLLEDAGYKVNDQTGLTVTEAMREGMLNGTIDMVLEYTGLSVSSHFGLPSMAIPADPDRTYLLAKTMVFRRGGFTVLDRSPFNNTLRLLMRDDGSNDEIQTIADLATFMNENGSPLSLCVDVEFFSRQGGLDALQQQYGFAFRDENILLMDLESTYSSLRDEKCDVSVGFATDGRIRAWDLRALEDVQHFFPYYNVMPVVQPDTLEANPGLAELINGAIAYLDDETMSQMNGRVDLGPDGIVSSGDEETPAQVAMTFLRENKLLKPPQITVGSADSVEQLILANMVMQLLNNSDFSAVDKSGLGTISDVRNALENGSIDLYIDFVVTALTTHLGLPTSALPADDDRTFALLRNLDASRGIVWLDRGGFSDTRLLMARGDLIENGIESLDDLAAYMNANGAPLSICIENDFNSNPNDNLGDVEQAYGFQFNVDNVLPMELDSVYQALRDGQCDVGIGHSTDGRISAWGFTALEDSQAYFAENTVAPVIRNDVLAANPKLADILNAITGNLDEETMRSLNTRVLLGADGEIATGDEETPAQVATSFLVDNGLIEEPAVEENAIEESTSEETAPSEAAAEETTSEEAGSEESQPADAKQGNSGFVPAASATLLNVTTLSTEASDLVTELIDSGQSQPQITIGSTQQPDAQLLGQMLVLMMEEVGYNVTDNLAFDDAATLRENMRAGTLDLYFETGRTALSTYHNLPEVTLPNEPDRIYSLAKRLDEANGVIWLQPTNAAGATTLIVRQEAWDDGITDIADLADYIGTFDSGPILCVDAAFLEDERQGLTALQEAYGITFAPENTLTMEAEEIYAALRDGQCDIAQGIRTDGRLQAWHLNALTDSLNYFVIDAPVPLVRQEFLQATPALQPYIEALANSLDQKALQQLNAVTTIGEDGLLNSGDEASLRDAAAAYLCANEIVGTCQLDTSAISSGEETPVESATDEVVTEESTDSDTGSDTGNTESIAAEESSVVDETATSGESTSTESTSTEETAEATPATSTEEEADGDLAIAPPVLIAGVTVTVPDTYGVNARSTASTDAPVVDVLPKSATLTAVGRLADNSWIQIIMPDETLAWIFSDAVFFTEEQLDTLPTVVPPSLASSQ